MKRRNSTAWRALGAAAFALLGSIAGAHAAGDPVQGLKVFVQCKACHSLDAGKNGIGPSLHGLFGRKAGAVPGFAYSEAMKNSSIVWEDGTLLNYLIDPKVAVPGDKMPFPGLKDEAKRQDVVAYLKTATQ